MTTPASNVTSKHCGAQELIAAQKALVASLPNGEAELANFAQLGQAQPVQVTL